MDHAAQLLQRGNCRSICQVLVGDRHFAAIPRSPTRCMAGVTT